MILVVAAKELVLAGIGCGWAALLSSSRLLAVCAAALAQFETASTLSASRSRSLLSTSQGIVAFGLLAAIAVTGATTNLAVASGRRGYALLQLAGLLPRQLVTVVLTQLVMLAVIGTGIGVAIGRVIAQPLLDLAIAQASAPAGTVVVYGGGTVVWAFGCSLVSWCSPGFAPHSAPARSLRSKLYGNRSLCECGWA